MSASTLLRITCDVCGVAIIGDAGLRLPLFRHESRPSTVHVCESCMVRPISDLADAAVLRVVA